MGSSVRKILAWRPTDDYPIAVVSKCSNFSQDMIVSVNEFRDIIHIHTYGAAIHSCPLSIEFETCLWRTKLSKLFIYPCCNEHLWVCLIFFIKVGNTLLIPSNKLIKLTRMAGPGALDSLMCVDCGEAKRGGDFSPDIFAVLPTVGGSGMSTYPHLGAIRNPLWSPRLTDPRPALVLVSNVIVLTPSWTLTVNGRLIFLPIGRRKA